MRLQRHRRHEVYAMVDGYARGLEQQGIPLHRCRTLIRLEMRRLDVQLRRRWARERECENRRMRRLLDRDRRRQRFAVGQAATDYDTCIDSLLDSPCPARPARSTGPRPSDTAPDAVARTPATAAPETEACAAASDLPGRVHLTLAGLAFAPRGGHPPTAILQTPVTVLGWLAQAIQTKPQDLLGPVAPRPGHHPDRPVLCVAVSERVRTEIVAQRSRTSRTVHTMSLPGVGDAVIVEPLSPDEFAVALIRPAGLQRIGWDPGEDDHAVCRRRAASGGPPRLHGRGACPAARSAGRPHPYRDA